MILCSECGKQFDDTHPWIFVYNKNATLCSGECLGKFLAPKPRFNYPRITAYENLFRY